MALDFDIGDTVRCEGETCGRLLKVVIDPHTRRVTDLIVERGFLNRTDLVVPVSIVEDAGDEGVSLAIEKKELEEYPEYHEEELRRPPTGWGTGKRYDAENTRCWVEPYAVACQQPVQPMVRYKVHEGIRSDREVIERGTPVSNAGGRYGRVDHVLVDPASGEMRYLVVRRGLIPYYPVVPIELAEYIDEDGVYVRASTETLNELPRFRARSDEDIQSEMEARLQELDLDVSDLRATVEEGSAQLAGMVVDVASKRRAEATVRAIPGVVAVDNALDTSLALAARVMAAVADDPRTHLAVIDVTAERGIVTLSGQVDSPEVKQAAEEIASQQPGVISVVNALEVSPDEFTPSLGFAATLGVVGGKMMGGAGGAGRY